MKYAPETWSWNRPSNSSFIHSFVLTDTFNHQVRNILSLFSRSVVSDSVRPHGLQHTRLPCPSSSQGFAQIDVL